METLAVLPALSEEAYDPPHKRLEMRSLVVLVAVFLKNLLTCDRWIPLRKDPYCRIWDILYY